MEMKKRLLAGLLAAVLVFCLAACSSEEKTPDSPDASESNDAVDQTPQDAGASDETPADGRTLTIGTTENMKGFNFTQDSSLVGSYLCYDGLFMMNPETGSMEPLLVEDYYFEDNLTLVLQLKDGVYFSSGDQLTGEDVLYTFERYIIDNAQLAPYYTYFDFDSSTVSDDGLTVTLKYNQEFGPALAFLDRPIESKAYVESHLDYTDNAWWNETCGSGPYACVENVDGDHVTFALREDYWGDETYDYQTITFKYYGDVTAMGIDFETGALDMVLGAMSEDAERVEGGSVAHSAVAYSPQANCLLLCFDETLYPQFADIKVREAVAHAIDYEALGVAAYGTLFQVPTSTLSEDMNYYYNVGTYTYDPELAKGLMEEAGYADGFAIDVVYAQSTTTANLWECLQAYLAEIGITVNLSGYDRGTAVPMFIQGQTAAMTMESTGGCPQREPYLAYSSMYEGVGIFPAAQMNYPELQEYLTEALSNDNATRAEALKNAQIWFYENYEAIPLVDITDAILYNTETVGSVNLLSTTNANLRFVSAP